MINEVLLQTSAKTKNILSLQIPFYPLLMEIESPRYCCEVMDRSVNSVSCQPDNNTHHIPRL